MITIFKYPLKETRNEFEMPYQAQIIKCGYDPQGQLCLWAAVDTNQEMVPVTFVKIGTGWPLDEFMQKYNMSYVDSINEGPFVWHIFRLEEKPVLKRQWLMASLPVPGRYDFISAAEAKKQSAAAELTENTKREQEILELIHDAIKLGKYGVIVTTDIPKAVREKFQHKGYKVQDYQFDRHGWGYKITWDGE